MHYARWRRNGDTGESGARYASSDASLAERLAHTGWDVTATGCWEWRGHRRPSGYGVLGVGHQAVDYAHRVAWEVANGPIPDGMFICHRCDNPPCVNPEHLFLGTVADNVHDMRSKGRHARGARQGGAVLTDDDVRAIREMSASMSQRATAAHFGVSQQLVSGIVRRTRWAHVT